MKEHLVLINTTRCNFHCKHCIRDYYSDHVDIPLTLLDRVLLEAKELGFTRVAVTGGEPGLHPDFNAMMDLICDKHGYDWSVVTNASMSEIYDYALSKYSEKNVVITLSLDGGTEKTHDYIRRQGSFQKTLDTLDYYNSINLNTLLTFTANKINLNELPDLVQLAVDHNVDELRFSAIIPNHFNQKLRLTEKDRDNIMEFVDLIICENFPIRITNTAMLNRSSNVVQICGNLNEPEPAINPYGEYIFCCDTGGRGAVIGDLHEKSFSELYIDHIKKNVWIKNKRKELLENGETFPDFNSCHFCNKVLLDN